jgi:hypothetical protein
MNVDTRLALPVELLLAVLECSFARLSWAASASADVLAAARLRIFLATSNRRPSAHEEGIADVIVLSRGRNDER